MILRTVCVLIISCLFISESKGSEPVLIGFDGAYSLKGATSAQAIEQGALIAIDEINESGGVLGGRPLKLITLDNRVAPPRGIKNMKKFAKMKDLVAVLGGRFSPVIMSQLEVIHELKIPLIDAWGSANGITDHDYRPSYTFRVSLKDDLAMPTMLGYAKSHGIKKIGFLLLNTTWGRSNIGEAEKYALQDPDIEIVGHYWHYHGNTNLYEQYLKLKQAGAQAVVLVATSKEGALLVREMEKAGQPSLPIISHWGITGGSFFEQTEGAIKNIDLAVVQTFSLFNAKPEKVKGIMTRAAKLFGLQTINQVKSPVGFGHAYDSIHILARAIKIAGSTNRTAIRNALEKVNGYQGLVRDYDQVFTDDDHDALDLEQVFMARYRNDGVIVPLDLE